MASGSLGANELPREKCKWSENTKVYTRKVYRKPKNNNSSFSNVATISTSNKQLHDKIQGETSNLIDVVKGTTINDGVETNHEKVDKEVPNNENSRKEVVTTIDKNVDRNDENSIEEMPNNENTINEGIDNEKIIKEVPTNENNKNEVVKNSENFIEEVPINGDSIEEVPNNGNNIEEVPNNLSSISEVPNNETAIKEVPDNGKNIEELPVEEANLLQPQQNPTRIESTTLSGDSLSHNRVEVPLPNGHDHDGDLGNVVVMEERQLVTQIDDRLNISVTAAKSKEEVRDLKRKLEDELDQVRKMARKLEAKESELSSIDFDGGRLHGTPFVGRMNFHVNGRQDNGVGGSLRGNKELGSVIYSAPRSLSQLSVNVTNNSRHGFGENVHEKEKRTPKANKYYPNSDFVLGKEKFPPAESSRKAKSSGGGRKAHGDTGFAFDKKIHKKCNDLLQKLRNHKHGWVFNQPVDVERLGLRDYFDIIKHPMDLGTINNTLTNNWYKTPREFAEDVRLTFHNAMTYNPEGQDVHVMAKELLRIFEEKWPAIEVEFDRKLRYELYGDVGTPTPTSRKLYAPTRLPIHMPLPPPPILRPPPNFQDVRNLERSQSMPVRPDPRPKLTPKLTPLVRRTPSLKKPKARDPNKRDMTFDEKQKLSTNLQSLPSEKLDALAQIIKRRNSGFSQHDDEIEVDIDSVDAETLWELDRFVTNYKKSLSKYKRRAELAMQKAKALSTQAVQQTVPPAPPANVEAPRVERIDEGNVAAPHNQQEKHSDNASNNSSSSSSGSGSSSSDSDSDSSSDSE